ncbi:site-specific integrase [uncultured Roseibium sp.]|uniref:site-specific integrase n=1 Tax=uncultured Roseibium sp. TaxID=1936171 RepID=UPI002619CC59|nr:site-specific integrase [uncultured Roseibium sp.]
MSGHTRLYRRGAVYYHRAVVPADIVDTYGKIEEFFSLRTKDRTEALRRVRIKAVEVDNRFEEHWRARQARAAATTVDELSPDQIQAIKAIYHAHWLEEDEAVRLDGFREDHEVQPELPTPTFEEWQETTDELEEHVRKLRGRFKVDRFYESEVDEVSSWPGVNLNVSPGTKAFKQFAAALQDAALQAFKDMRSRNEGDYVSTPEPEIEVAPACPKLSVALGDWIEEKSKEDWTEATAKEHWVWTEQFMLLCGDRPIDQYGKDDARQFKQVLLKLPPNWKKKAALKGQAIDRAAETAVTLEMQTMSTTSINKVLRFVGSFWRWAAGQYDGLRKDMFDGLSLSNKRRQAKSERNPFTLNELKELFSSPLFVGCKSIREWQVEGSYVPITDARYWAPLISLYSGARMNEILQLYVSDVVENYGVTCLSINADGDDKRLKTPSSERYLPVHPALAKLGFLKFVQLRRDAVEQRLFPETPLGANGSYSGPFSKHFKRCMLAAGIVRERVSFHSLRHNFEDFCRAGRLPMDMVEVLQGRAQRGERDRYGYGEVFFRTLEDSVHEIDFSSIDLSHLKDNSQLLTKLSQSKTDR